MVEHVAIWVFLVTHADAINPAAGISGEDVLWVIGAVVAVLGIVAAWDRRADKRTLEHIKTQTQPIKDDVAALRVNQAQWMRASGLDPDIGINEEHNRREGDPR